MSDQRETRVKRARRGDSNGGVDKHKLRPAAKKLRIYHAGMQQNLKFFPRTPAAVVQHVAMSLFGLQSVVNAEPSSRVFWLDEEGDPTVFFPHAFPDNLRLHLSVTRPDGRPVVGHPVSPSLLEAKVSDGDNSMPALEPMPAPAPEEPRPAWKWDLASIEGHGRESEAKGNVVFSTCHDGAGATSAAVDVELKSGKWAWRFVLMPIQCCVGVHLVPSGERHNRKMLAMHTVGKAPVDPPANAVLYCSVDLDAQDRVLVVRLNGPDGTLLSTHLVDVPRGDPVSPYIVWKHNSNCRLEGPLL